MNRSIYAVTALLALAATLTSTSHAEWTPDRVTFDYSRYGPSDSDCLESSSPASERGRCGALDGPVFNSFVNTPSYGDEMAFFDGRRYEDSHKAAISDPVRNVLHGSRTLVLRIYINNNGNERAGRKSTATGTRVGVSLPHGVSTRLRARAWISADNSAPLSVEDTVDIVADGRFKVTYVLGSAKLYLSDRSPIRLGDDIVTPSGVPINNEGIRGQFAAGFDKDAMVQLQIRVVPQENLSKILIGAVLAGIAVVLGCALSAFPATRRALRQTSGITAQLVTRDKVWESVLAILIATGIVTVVTLFLSSLLR